VSGMSAWAAPTIVRSLVANGRNRLGADGGEVDRAVAFFVDLANENDHITLDKVEAERDLLDALVNAVDALFRIRQDDVGLLVVTGEHADYGTSILENEEYAAVDVALEA